MAKKSSKNDEQIRLLKEQLARALADYDNLKKRLERERGDIEKIILGKLTARFLPVLDMLRKTQEHLGDAGLEISISQFSEALKDEGVEKIKVDEGDLFDEKLHEAVEIVSGEEDGRVAEIVMEGYKIKDGPVVRFAKVKVTKKEK